MANSEQEDEINTAISRFRAGVGSRLREVESRFKNRASAAAAAGVAKSTLQNWIEGRRDPSFEGMVRLAAKAGVSVDWLATGRDYLERESSQPGQDYVMIPRYDIEASAESGALMERVNAVDFMAFQMGWVKQVLDADPNRLALISAKGDSMEPTIRAGDMLLIDTGVDRFLDDAIYVVAVDGHLLVKRVQMSMGGGVAVKSDNLAYVEQTLSPEAAAAAAVAGRVRWIGRLI